MQRVGLCRFDLKNCRPNVCQHRLPGRLGLLLALVLTLAAGLDSRQYKAYQKCSYALVAQLDRALASGAKGREFESRRAHHKEFKRLAVKS